MEQDSQQDAVHAAITTAEHKSLGNVLAVVRRLEELRARGLSSAQIAERIRLTHPSRPGGGPWSAEVVERVLEIADANRQQSLRPSTAEPASQLVPPTLSTAEPTASPEHRSVNPDRTARPTSHTYPPPVHHSTPDVDRDIRQQPVAEASAERVDHRSPAHVAVGGHRHDEQPMPLRVEPRRYHRRPTAQPEATFDPDPGRRWPAVAGILTLIGLVAVGVGLNQVGVFDRFTTADFFDRFTTADDQAAPASSETTGVTTADDPLTGDEATGEEAAAPAGEGDAADSLIIRIDPSTPETDDGIAPASATIRSDGKLYVEGAFRSESEAQQFLETAADVFGEAALVPSYTIDPAAPDPTVSDVVLEKPILFESGSAVIDPEYIPFLDACGDVLKLNSHIVMSVSAFTDAAGSAQFNLELSQQRADAVIAYYRSLDIGDDQLISTGLGESGFVADNDTEVGRQQNRRAMLELLNVMKAG